MVIFSVHIPAASTKHEVCTENAVTTKVNLKQWPGNIKAWIIVSRWHSGSSPEGKEGPCAVRRRLCGRRWWHRRGSKQKNQAALADAATLVLQTFGSLTTELSRLITVIFFPSYTVNPSLPLTVLTKLTLWRSVGKLDVPLQMTAGRCVCVISVRTAREVYSVQRPLNGLTPPTSLFITRLRPVVFILHPQRTNGRLVELRQVISVL